jgi:hypothetical protein
LLAAARTSMARFGVPAEVRLTVARTLQEVAKYPYFYEGLLYFARQPAPQPDTLDEARAALREGRTLYGLGRVIGAA